ncbi:MAG: right-handed parallel beta-helix repeat-containing protein [Thermoflexales bacterium]|nr:right-handed parallel beta-helix repeat-containing protein [Thermoflexales bacterium]
MKSKFWQALFFMTLLLLVGAGLTASAADKASPEAAASARVNDGAASPREARSPLAFTTIITVNTTADTYNETQTRTCYFTRSMYSAASDGKCNLRRALVEASHRPMTDRPILIKFNLPLTDTNYNAVTGTWTIVMDGDYSSSASGEALVPGDFDNPENPDSYVTIDGATQSDIGGRSNGYPIVVINSGHTLDLVGVSHNTIRNLAFNGGGGVFLNDVSGVGGSNLVESVWVGLNADGTEIVPGDNPDITLAGGGISIQGDGNTISGTIVTGSNGGISVQGNDNLIQYNTIGTRGDKTVPADRLTCVASNLYNPAQWYGGWGFSISSGSNNQFIHNAVAGAHSPHSPTETAPPAIWTAGSNNLFAYNTIGIDGAGNEVGTCGQGIFVTGQSIQVLTNTIVNARTSFFVADTDDPTAGAIFVNDSSPLARQFTIRNNIVRDSTSRVIEFGPAVPESLRLFEPPRIVSISGTLVVGETEPGYDCPNCLVELYLDDLSEGQDALQLLTTAVIDDVAGTARFTATLPSPLPADRGIRLTATTQDDYVIGDYLAGTTTQMSPAYGIDATYTRQLAPGWNLFSIDVTPPSPAIADVLSSLAGQYDVVLAFDGGPAGGAKTYDPANPASSDLSTIDVAHGYWIHITAATTQTLRLDYEPARNDTAIPLYTGWNLVSYLPDVSMPVTRALDSIAGDYTLVQSFDGGGKTYMPGQPLYSDLAEMEPGFAYWIKASGVVSLTYPGYLAERSPSETSSSSTAAQGAAASYFFTPTTEWADFYGVATLSGYSAPRNASVVAYDPSGVAAGAFTVHTPPYYGFLHVYADDPNTAGDEGAQAGDEIRFTINGRLATPSKSATWTARGDATELNLNVVMPFQSTNEWSDFWGTLTLNGAPAPVGTIVAAYDPAGLYIGDYVLTAAGQYGFLHAYGDDASTAADEGAVVGDALSFRAFLPLSTTPIALTPSASATWQGRGSRTEINLSGTAGPVAPSAVRIAGPINGQPNVPYTFTITVDPVDVTTPLDYVIERTDVTQPVTASLGREIVFRNVSWATEGPKHITVTASNEAGDAVGTYTIAIGAAAPRPEVFHMGPLGGTWVFTNPLGLRTRVRVPAGVLTQTATFTYTESRDPAHAPPAGLRPAGRNFDLRASWPFNGRITVTLEYREQDWMAANIDPESSLRLYYWNRGSSAWENVATTCGAPVPSYAPFTDANVLVATLCHLSEFALLGAGGEEKFAIYLPLVVKNN